MRENFYRTYDSSASGRFEHSALIAVLILDRPLCLECIETKSSITRAEVDRYLTAIAQSPLELRRRDDERCRNCGEDRLVFSLHRSMEMGNT